MVGLSIVLEAQKVGASSEKTTQVINKATMMINKLPSPSSSSLSYNNPCYRNDNISISHSSSSLQVLPFLEQCFLCGQKLLPGKDIYMYKGDKAFCSVECRCRQIFMDEEDNLRKDNCSLAAMKPTSTAATASSSSSSGSRHRKSNRNRAGGFAY